MNEFVDNLPWVEKYRPSKLDDVAGHDGVIATVRTFVSKRQIPHLLFYGPPGTGKTSTIVAIAKEIYGQNYRNMVLELNASDDRGIDVVRNEIKTFASTRQIFTQGFKLVVLDEADAMTNVAQNALRRIIEKYSAHTRFCILANYHHKLNPALVSRCTRFRFAPLAVDDLKERCEYVIREENVLISLDGLDAVVQLANGDMRKALNVLQACHARVEALKPIEASHIYECVGSPDPRDIQRLMQTLMEDSWGLALSTFKSIKEDKGLALADILTLVAQEFVEAELPNGARAKILQGLSDIEYRLSSGGSESIQTSAMIGCVKGAIA